MAEKFSNHTQVDSMFKYNSYSCLHVQLCLCPIFSTEFVAYTEDMI